MKPILFNTEMVKAILEGRKTQTRRLIKPQPILKKNGWYWSGTRPKAKKGTGSISVIGVNASPSDILGLNIYSRTKIGDILYARETWHPKRHNMPTDLPYEYKATAKEDGNPTDEPWEPSIHMPKDAARIFLKVTDVRVERLQDISEQGAIAEGVEIIHMAEPTIPVFRKYNLKEKLGTTNPILSFKTLWNEIYKNWDANPFVWVYEFKRIDNPKY